MGFFSSIAKAFSGILDPIKNLAAGFGLYTPSSVKRDQEAMKRMQEDLVRQTNERKKQSEQEKMTEEERIKRLKQRSQRGSRRSLLFDDDMNSNLKDTLG